MKRPLKRNILEKANLKIIISGGGTGGHVFPAIAIADALKKLKPGADILFVGAKGKIEMEKVPAAGYPIKGLWISGFHRQLTLRNLAFPLKVASSLWQSRQIIREFKPDVAVGVGGFASGPILRAAAHQGIPTLIQEQNSYAGVTNRLLSRNADRICVAYEKMEQYFPAEKIALTGNPVRKDLVSSQADKSAAAVHFGLDPGKPTVFVFGGSLGALSINEAMEANAGLLAEHPEIQVLWQVGKLYQERFGAGQTAALPNVQVRPFIDRMDLAYSLADLVVCRAGALTIAELQLLGKPAILIPSPNVAEDHQTKNARALVEKDAAVMLPNKDAAESIIRKSLDLLNDPEKRALLSGNMLKMAKPDAAEEIARMVVGLGEVRGERVRE